MKSDKDHTIADRINSAEVLIMRNQSSTDSKINDEIELFRLIAARQASRP